MKKTKPPIDKTIYQLIAASMTFDIMPEQIPAPIMRHLFSKPLFIGTVTFEAYIYSQPQRNQLLNLN